MLTIWIELIDKLMATGPIEKYLKFTESVNFCKSIDYSYSTGISQ